MMNIAAACAAAFSLTALRITMYLTASRRMPGAWLLHTAAYGFLLLLQKQWLFLLTDADMPLWLEDLCLLLPPYALVFAACLGALAGFRRWKTREAFLGDMRALARKLRAAQDSPDD